MFSSHSESDACRTLLGLPGSATSLDICRKFERLAVALAPDDFNGLPFYAMPTSHLPPAFTTASRHTGGWYSCSAHYFLQPHLPHYRGPGPACVLVDRVSDERRMALAKAAQDVYAARGETVPIDELLEFAPSELRVDEMFGVLAHELIHAIDSLTSGEFAEWGDMFEGAPAEKHFRRLVERKSQENEPPPPLVDCHGLQFTRIAAHFDYRLRSLGLYSVELGRTCAGECYQQREYSACYAALGDEMAEMAGSTFKQITDAPIPPAFAACALAESSTCATFANDPNA